MRHAYTSLKGIFCKPKLSVLNVFKLFLGISILELPKITTTRFVCVELHVVYRNCLVCSKRFFLWVKVALFDDIISFRAYGTTALYAVYLIGPKTAHSCSVQMNCRGEGDCVRGRSESEWWNTTVIRLKGVTGSAAACQPANQLNPGGCRQLRRRRRWSAMMSAVSFGLNSTASRRPGARSVRLLLDQRHRSANFLYV